VRALPWSKICCAVDFSSQSKQALELAAGLTRRLDAELLLFHVSGLPRNERAPFSATLSEEAEERETLVEWQWRAIRLARRGVDAVMIAGVPAEEIVGFARRSCCSLLVLGTHGRTGLSRAVFGSVAEQVVRLAPCPVLTVRPEAQDFDSAALDVV
jgi:universal stress protein A